MKKKKHDRRRFRSFAAPRVFVCRLSPYLPFVMQTFLAQDIFALQDIFSVRGF